LIEWDSAHPVDAMPDSGLALQSLQVSYPRPADLVGAYAAIGLKDVTVEKGMPNLIATLATPNRLVTLESGGF